MQQAVPADSTALYDTSPAKGCEFSGSRRNIMRGALGLMVGVAAAAPAIATPSLHAETAEEFKARVLAMIPPKPPLPPEGATVTSGAWAPVMQWYNEANEILWREIGR